MTLPSGARACRTRRSTSAAAALLLGVLAALVAPTGAAFAATGGATGPVAGSSTTASAAPAVKAHARPKAATGPAAAGQAHHDAAIREIRAADLPESCSGALDPVTVYHCATVPQDGAAYTLTVAKGQDLLAYEVASQGDDTLAMLTGPDGQSVSCQSYGNFQQRCPSVAAGTYTLTVTGRYGLTPEFSVSYLMPLSTAGCTAVSEADTALGDPRHFTGTLAAGSIGDCYALPSAAGDTLRVLASVYSEYITVYDAVGTVVCWQNNPCRLTGTAPYRALVWTDGGTTLDYAVTATRLSDPQGCAAVQVQPYGSVPAASTSPCRTLHIPADGSYLIGASSADRQVTGALSTTDGTEVPCYSGDDYMAQGCALSAGDYIWAAGTSDIPAAGFALALHKVGQTDGCTTGRDDTYASGQAQAAVSAPGQEFCWTLPTATGSGLYLATTTTGPSLTKAVYDAKGISQCETDYSFDVCKLTGTAPFRMVLAAPATATYQVTVQRTGNTAGCTTWPRTAYGSGSAGAHVALTATAQTACLALPAGGHSTGEVFDYTDTGNQLNASFQVYDAKGDKVCSSLGSSLAPCALASGVSYAALLVGTGRVDTYDVARHDVSGGASCAAPASTAMGGASTGYTLSSALDERCLRVSAAAGDRMWFAVRTPGAARKTGAELLVFDGTGRILCWQHGSSCRATGGTSYVVVIAADYGDAPIAAHVDTWKVGTASGWAPQCTAHPLTPDTFTPRSGTLTETATAYCAVMPVTTWQRFNVYGTDSETSYPATPQFDMFSADASRWAGTSIDSYYQCFGQNYGTFAYQCLADGNATATQAVLILSPGDTAAPLEYTMQGVCQSGCASQTPLPTIGGLSTSTGQSGTQNQLVVHGAHLTLDTQVELSRNGAAVGTRPSTAVAITGDSTSLTVLLDTGGVSPGTYDVSLVRYGSPDTSEDGTLHNAYTVTAAPAPARSTLVPLSPTRFLDTRYGTGAPKARVGAGGVVKLKVAGAHGVPATGVSAVVMNVTAVNPSTGGFVTVYPDGQPLPSVSNVNFRAGQTIPSLVTVPVGANGTVDLRNTYGAVDLVADVTGYYTSSGGGSSLKALSPTRFLDTRYGTGAPKARVGAGGVVKLKVAGAHGVPATGVSAVVMNVTAVNPTSSGFVTVYPDGSAVPQASNLNFTKGETIPNLVIVPVAANGTVDLRNAYGTVDLVADVTGYYTASGAGFSTAGPVRLLDTRTGLGARAGTVGPGGVVSIPVAGVAGVPSQDEGLTAVVLNVTVTGPSTSDFLTVHPHGRPLPGASNLNFTKGETISNLVVVPVIDGRITFANHFGTVNVVADLNGYFTSTTA
ncbi:hypothetical protein [Actinacidiphila paucisporea]|uniref:Uncharacterized protein n=1 Tax=Actinacidiphila paucisporea TaxID=310782 RepID=A0A1M6ZB57_9ACTN|nr:hypothetical protein [Actinacidiphila paucisporea]SHL27736.1 hypothetical protein SAMN05216499_103277 [Actinacidiphila paucisporea]